MSEKQMGRCLLLITHYSSLITVLLPTGFAYLLFDCGSQFARVNAAKMLVDNFTVIVVEESRRQRATPSLSTILIAGSGSATFSK